MVFDPHNEDLFEDTKMSFGEHLEELRVVLVRALIGLTIGFMIALLVAGRVVSYLQTPLKEAITDFTIERAKEEIKRENDNIIPPEIEPRLNQDRLTPKDFKVDPEILLAFISQESDIDVAAFASSMPSYSVRPTQLIEGTENELSMYLVANGESNEELGEKGAQAKQIWQQFTDAEKKMLRQLSQESSSSAADREQIVAMLNRVANESELYTHEAFNPLFQGKVPRKGWRSWIPGFARGWFDENTERSLALQKFRADLQEGPDQTTQRRLNNWLISLTLHEYLTEPVQRLDEIRVWESTEINPQALNAHEVFMIWLKAALIVGLVISSPWVFYQIWVFVAAGLYPHEKNYVYIYVPFSIALFIGGALLAFFFVFKPVLTFLFSFNAAMGIDPQPRIGEWLSFVMFLPIGFGVAFQLPLVMLFLNRIGLVSMETFIDKWRIAVLVIAFLSMILTPADPISMILLGLPLTLLYFFGIGLCRWMPKGRNPFSEAYEPS